MVHTIGALFLWTIGMSNKTENHIIKYRPDGQQTIFVIPVEYIQIVSVELDGMPIPYTENPDKTITLQSPPNANSELIITVLIYSLDAGPSEVPIFTQTLEETPGQFDDYREIIYLPEQLGDDTVKTFEFNPVVQYVVVEVQSLSTDLDEQDALRARITTDLQSPTASLGAIAKSGIPVTLLGTISSVNVLAPSNSSINVYGKRR